MAQPSREKTTWHPRLRVPPLLDVPTTPLDTVVSHCATSIQSQFQNGHVCIGRGFSGLRALLSCTRPWLRQSPLQQAGHCLWTKVEAQTHSRALNILEHLWTIFQKTKSCVAPEGHVRRLSLGSTAVCTWEIAYKTQMSRGIKKIISMSKKQTQTHQIYPNITKRTCHIGGLSAFAEPRWGSCIGLHWHNPTASTGKKNRTLSVVWGIDLSWRPQATLSCLHTDGLKVLPKTYGKMINMVVKFRIWEQHKAPIHLFNANKTYHSNAGHWTAFGLELSNKPHHHSSVRFNDCNWGSNVVHVSAKPYHSKKERYQLKVVSNGYPAWLGGKVTPMGWNNP